MRDAGREMPQVALADIGDEGATIMVDRRDVGAPLQHIGPLALLVPVHLAGDIRFSCMLPLAVSLDVGNSRMVAWRAQPLS
jgi:hypothetical protein